MEAWTREVEQKEDTRTTGGGAEEVEQKDISDSEM